MTNYYQGIRSINLYGKIYKKTLSFLKRGDTFVADTSACKKKYLNWLSRRLSV
jgi:hypothetical protein